MNVQAIQRLRARLAHGTSVYGMWVTLEAPSITEIGVALGLDWIVIDAEHGHLDWKEIVEHLRAAARSNTVMLVRLAEENVGLIKRALDVGADGIIIPKVESVAQLERIIHMAHFPPRGMRGIGAERATCWGQAFPQHVREAAAETLIVPLIESVEGMKNLSALLQVKGAEIFWFGPADLSATAGFPGQWEGPGVAESLVQAIRQVANAGKHPGILVRNEADLQSRRNQGVRLLGLGQDAGLMIASLRRLLGSIGKEPFLDTSLVPIEIKELVERSKKQPLQVLPALFHPDRGEVINQPGKGPQIELEKGILLDCLVGAHNQARRLTTGIVSLEKGALLPYHAHSVGESITVLEGEVLFAVEGRTYRLGRLDNITVPAGLAHRVLNPSGATARAHVALASDSPDRIPIDEPFPESKMPDDSTGIRGKEHVVRFESARRYEAGPHTEFIDHLNSDLIPGIEMSGGYGLFYPGGRLPAHLHDFDESICIIEGRATCNVEGRKYSMSNRETALQPRGRVHYFVNESDDRMAMLWVYAGPQPERILIDEKWTQPGSSTWQSVASPKT
jgi:2-keto-3-deoxy-L-rhamnonate aldolase RhmA/quercetin dioxygenase-like cupin family protein